MHGHGPSAVPGSLDSKYGICAHRDEMTKEIILSPTYASPGFSIWKPEAGVLKVALHVYQVLNDHTPYEVEVMGKELGE